MIKQIPGEIQQHKDKTTACAVRTAQLYCAQYDATVIRESSLIFSDGRLTNSSSIIKKVTAIRSSLMVW